MNWKFNLGLGLILFIYNAHALNKTRLNEYFIDLALDYQIQHQLIAYPQLEHLEPFLEDYLNRKNFKESESFFLKNQKQKFSIQLDSIISDLSNTYPLYKPTLYAVEDVGDNQFDLKIALIGNFDGLNSIYSTHNLKIEQTESDCFKFINTTDLLLNKKSVFQQDNVTFYFNGNSIPEEQLQKHFNFEQKLLDFFEVYPIDYNIIAFDDTKELYTFLGYDYHDAMYLNESYGGMYLPYNKTILSGNNTVYYPHELVHLYESQRTNTRNILLSEGIATYLGGSIGYNYEYHINNLKSYLKENSLNFYDLLLDTNEYNKIIGKHSSFKYSAGAFLCHLVNKCFGKKGVWELLSADNSEESLNEKLMGIFGMGDIELKSFLDNALSEFLSLDKNI